jgi:hypothetical protein
VGKIAHPRSPVDRRPHVVTVVAELRVAGMHADAQSDRGDRRALQLQRARHRVAGAAECDDEAVALPLLHGPHATMGTDEIRKCTIQAHEGRRHRLGLGLPQPRQVLNVGQQ